MSDIRDRFRDPAYLRQRERYVRQRIERAAVIKGAILRAKRGQPLLLLELIEPEDVRRAIEEVDVLPRRKKRGKPFTSLGRAENELRRMLERQRRIRFNGQVPHGTAAKLVERKLIAMADSGELTPEAAAAEIPKLINKLRRGPRRTKGAHRPH
jgi:hypothetical protein